jgi:hypothetical protein
MMESILFAVGAYVKGISLLLMTSAYFYSFQTLTFDERRGLTATVHCTAPSAKWPLHNVVFISMV